MPFLFIKLLKNITPCPDALQTDDLAAGVMKSIHAEEEQGVFSVGLKDISLLPEAVFNLWDRFEGASGTAPIPFFPARFICSDKAGDLDGVWRVAPAGGVLIPKEKRLNGVQPWFYGWNLLWTGRLSGSHNPFFSVMAMMVPGGATGEMEDECFFCGSRWHDPSSCTIITSHIPSDGSGGGWLASRRPDAWIEDLPRMNRSMRGGWFSFSRKDASLAPESRLQYGINVLLARLRYVFTPWFAARICLTGAENFSYMDKVPDQQRNSSALKQSIAMAQKGDMERCSQELRRLDSHLYSFEYNLLSGMVFMAQGEQDRAMLSWIEAERTGRTPLRIAYAALLQGRLDLIKHDCRGAIGAFGRAATADQTMPYPLYWKMACRAAKLDCSGVIPLFSGLTSSPELLCSAMVDPMFVGCSTGLEREFRRFWDSTEDLLRKKVELLDSRFEEVKRVFGPRIGLEERKRLMFWRGQWARMGCAHLAHGSAFLDGLERCLNRSAVEAVSRMCAGLSELINECESLCSMLSSSKKERRIRERYLHLKNSSKSLLSGHSRMGLASAIKAGKDLTVLLAEAESLITEMKRIFHRKWRNRLIMRWICYGTGTVALLTGLLYLYLQYIDRF